MLPPDYDHDDVAGRIVAEMAAAPSYQAMMTELAERTQRLRAKYEGVDVTTLGEDDWQEWLSVHHRFDRDRAKGLRQQHRHKLKVQAKAEGRPWHRNDPRARS